MSENVAEYVQYDYIFDNDNVNIVDTNYNNNHILSNNDNVNEHDVDFTFGITNEIEAWVNSYLQLQTNGYHARDRENLNRLSNVYSNEQHELIMLLLDLATYEIHELDSSGTQDPVLNYARYLRQKFSSNELSLIYAIYVVTIMPADSFSGIQLKPKKTVNVSQQSLSPKLSFETKECPICYCQLKNSFCVKTSCNHSYCSGCFIEIYKRRDDNEYPCCALCRSKVDSIETYNEAIFENIKKFI
jgi:hypothetical protein